MSPSAVATESPLARSRVTRGDPLRESLAAVHQRLSNAERELRIQFTRIAQLQAQLDVLLGALRRLPPGVGVREPSAAVGRDVAHRVPKPWPRARTISREIGSKGRNNVHFNVTLLVDKSELPKLVHEEVEARSGHADHLGDDLLRRFGMAAMRSLGLAVSRNSKGDRAAFRGVEHLVDAMFFDRTRDGHRSRRAPGPVS